MKQFAIAALLSFTSAVKVTEEYRPNPVQSPWAAKAKPGPPATAITGAYNPKDKFASFYTRTVPERFTKESDDRLMNSLISNYAVEGKSNGAPNGKFFLTKKGAR